MKLNKVTTIIVTIITTFTIFTLATLWEVYISHNTSIQTQSNRIKSIEIVNKYKSDILQLNEFVKNYISTANPKYLLYYYDLLAINSGSKPQPLYYDKPAYWSSVMTGEIEHIIENDSTKEDIISKMRKEGFSNDELNQLNTLNNISEEIKKIEQIAFAVTQGLYDPISEEFIDDGEPNLEFAQNLIYSKDYLRLSNEVLKAIDKLIIMTETRTQNIVEEAGENLRTRIYWVIVFVLLNAIIILLIYFATKRHLLKPIFTLTTATKEVSNKNYDFKIENDHWLYELELLGNTFNDMANDISNDIKIREKNRIEIETAKKLLEETHKKTKDSIEYASLIQKTLIPNNKDFENDFSDYFITWEPKDVVGGDIYFYQKLRNENESILMVIDCTGHGVHGAFVTLLVKAIERNIISNILNTQEIVSPAKILSIFNGSIKHLMKQDNADALSNAGFDGQILYFNKDTKEIKFASAKNELIYIQNDEVNIIKGNRHSIGYKDSDANYKFTEHVLTMKDNTTLYLSSDGYWDQIGGEKERSFGKKRFVKLIEEIKDKSLKEQKEILNTRLKDYQGNHPRQDDITVIGLKF